MLLKQVPTLPFNDNFAVQVQIRIFSSGNDYIADMSTNLDKWYRFHIGLKQNDLEELNAELQLAIEKVSGLLISDDFSITIEDFFVREFAIKHNPFVILNACLTGTISPLYTSNWAALFWGRGARGVLATEFHVPDSFAAAFTGVLYQHFLSGKPIGEALIETRRHFWAGKANPLGLAYALYSSPSIRIAK